MLLLEKKITSCDWRRVSKTIVLYNYHVVIYFMQIRIKQVWIHLAVTRSQITSDWSLYLLYSPTGFN